MNIFRFDVNAFEHDINRNHGSFWIFPKAKNTIFSRMASNCIAGKGAHMWVKWSGLFDIFKVFDWIDSSHKFEFYSENTCFPSNLRTVSERPSNISNMGVALISMFYVLPTKYIYIRVDSWQNVKTLLYRGKTFSVYFKTSHNKYILSLSYITANLYCTCLSAFFMSA